MKNNINRILAVWLCVVIFATSFLLVVNVNVSAYTTRDPIYIYGNADFTFANGVSNPGAAGTEADPYIIEGWDISALSAHGIEILNTNKYFIIRNCRVHDGKTNYNDGILFYNVQNGRIEKTSSSNNYIGIFLYYSRYNNIFNNSVSNNGYGIYLRYSRYNDISNNSANSNNGHGIYLSSSSNNNNIFNNNVNSNNYQGIHLYYSSYNNIFNNNASNNGYYGIYLHYSSYNNVSKNSVNSNNYIGIYLSRSSYNTLSDNSANLNNDCGIFLWNSNYNNMSNNSASNNEYGISFCGSYNTLINNTFENSGIFIYGSTIDYFNTHNIDTTNTANGKSIYYYKNQNGINIDGWSAGQIILANCTNFTIKNVDCSNATVGVQLGYCNYCSIENSIFNNEAHGIHLRYSSNNNISNNGASNNHDGICLDDSSNNNNIFNNVANSNNRGGICLHSSNDNNISNNSANSNNWCSIEVHSSSNNNILNNTANSNTYFGIILYWYSSDNNIYSNSFLSNYFGIYFSNLSYLNRVYHNNFVDNAYQGYDFGVNQWDDGYPSGGNYWSDYTGPDDDGDGIGDVPYDIPGESNQDRYPLMSPWSPIEISVTKVFIPSEITTISQEVVSSINITNIGDVDITSISITDEYVDNMAPNNPPEVLVTITSDEGEVYTVMPEDLDVIRGDSDITISFELPLWGVPIFWENGTLQFGEELYYLESIPKDWVVGVQYTLYPVTELEIGTYVADAAVTAYSETGASTTETATGMLIVSPPIEPKQNHHFGIGGI